MEAFGYQANSVGQQMLQLLSHTLRLQRGLQMNEHVCLLL